MSQSQKVWLVTGTTAGLGRCLVDELLKAGKSVIATTRNAKALQAKFNEAYDAATLKRVLVVGLDITKVDEVKAVFAKAIDKFGRVDVVVNNAAYGVLGEIESIPLEAAREQFDVVFWGPVLISKEAIRVFREVNPAGEGGIVINIGSFAGYTAAPGISFYSSAKFALEGFTESIRKEVIPAWNIQAVVVQLGGFNTDWKTHLSTIPPHPAYDVDNSPTKQQRAMLGGALSLVGSAEKAAKAFLTIAEKRKELPVRIQLGTDSITVVRHTAKKTLSDSDKFESLSHSTNVDGTNVPEFTKTLLANLG